MPVEGKVGAFLRLILQIEYGNFINLFAQVNKVLPICAQVQ